MGNTIPLSRIDIGEKCKITRLCSNGPIRRRLLDLGLIKGTEVKSLHRSPIGDPAAYLIRGAIIAFRSDLASTILVEKIHPD